MLELGNNPECPFALNARDTTILASPSGRKPWERFNGSHIRLEQGSLQKAEKALYIYKSFREGTVRGWQAPGLTHSHRFRHHLLSQRTAAVACPTRSAIPST